jgi:hypothetical protein
MNDRRLSFSRPRCRARPSPRPRNRGRFRLRPGQRRYICGRHPRLFQRSLPAHRRRAVRPGSSPNPPSARLAGQQRESRRKGLVPARPTEAPPRPHRSSTKLGSATLFQLLPPAASRRAVSGCWKVADFASSPTRRAAGFNPGDGRRRPAERAAVYSAVRQGGLRGPVLKRSRRDRRGRVRIA